MTTESIDHLGTGLESIAKGRLRKRRAVLQVTQMGNGQNTSWDSLELRFDEFP